MARVLVIDDEHNIRMMIRLALEHAGHTVEVAADGNEGLDKFGDGADWDLALLDQRMPGLEGLSVLRQMLHIDSRARIIMVTAFGTVDLAVEAMKAGATDFLRKPFTAETLRGTVNAALQNAVESTTSEAISQSLTFGMTTFNGFRIEFARAAGVRLHGDLAFQFTIRSPEGEARQCTVVLSPVVLELIKAHTDCDTLPGGDRFWQAVCEEALVNYIYQNADFPPDNFVKVDELTTGLRRFVDTILAPG